MKITSFQATRYLFLLTAAILTMFGFGTLTRIGENPDKVALYAFYALAMFVDAVIMLFFYFQLNKRRRFIYWLAVIVLVLNIVLTIFDQVGLVDVLFMLLNAVTLAALYLSRNEFLPE
jgi:lysylphosphatidylglycerol synthetase-like protein (DUF2156 family)